MLHFCCNVAAKARLSGTAPPSLAMRGVRLNITNITILAVM